MARDGGHSSRWRGLRRRSGEIGVRNPYPLDAFRYKYDFGTGPRATAVQGQRPEVLFGPDNVDNPGRNILFAESTFADDAYDARQDLSAMFAMFELPVVSAVSIMAGARLEHSRQVVSTSASRADLDTTDLLPASTVTWKFAEDMQVRAGFSRTVSRPDFRELSESRFFSIEDGREVVGNPNLQRATISNYDARWEWYWSGDETVSVAGFFKQFDKPIETVILPTTGFKASWTNAKSATNVGVELDARKRLEFLHEALEDAYLAANVAWIRSRVELGEQTVDAEAGAIESTNTNTKRPLQGQSPYVVNLQAGYDDSREAGTGLSASLLYNVFGRRISDVGSFGRPDIYEEPVHQLDFVLQKAWGEHLKATARASNLLDGVRRRSQGTETVERCFAGRAFSVGLSYSY